MAKKLSDIEAIRAVQDGDERLIGSFYKECKEYFNQNHRKIFDYRDLGEQENCDIFQDSFSVVWNEIRLGVISIEDNYVWRRRKDGQKKRMTANLKTFVLDVAKNKNHERWRIEVKKESIDDLLPYAKGDADDDGAFNLVEDPDGAQDEMTQEKIVQLCMEQLPTRCKEILTLFYIDGKSLAEISELRGGTSYDYQKKAKYECFNKYKTKVMEAFRHYNLRGYGK